MKIILIIISIINPLFIYSQSVDSLSINYFPDSSCVIRFYQNLKYKRVIEINKYNKVLTDEGYYGGNEDSIEYSISYHKNGILKMNKKYDKNQKLIDGNYLEYNNKGQIELRKIFKNGIEIDSIVYIKSNYLGESIICKFYIKDTIINSMEKFSCNIVPLNVQNIKNESYCCDLKFNRNFTGIVKLFYNTGQLMLHGQYINNSPIGIFKYFNKFGKLIRKEYYSKGYYKCKPCKDDTSLLMIR